MTSKKSYEFQGFQRKITLFDDNMNHYVEKLQKCVIQWLTKYKNNSKLSVRVHHYNKCKSILAKIIFQRKLSELGKKRYKADNNLYQNYQETLKNKMILATQQISKAKWILKHEKNTFKSFHSASKYYKEMLKQIATFPTIHNLKYKIQKLQFDIQLLEQRKPRKVDLKINNNILIE